MSNFFKVASQSQLPPIDEITVNLGDMGYTLDDGGFWVVQQPSAPPGASPVWSFIDILRGPPGPQGDTGVGVPGAQGNIGPPGLMGGRGPQGPAGQNSFSQLSDSFSIPAITDPPLTIDVTDTSWMSPGELLYVPGAGTFNVVSSPLSPYTVQIVNSGDPDNEPAGTVIGAGVTISPANMRGPTGPQGIPGPTGPPGPQGVAGTSVFSTLAEAFTIPPVGTPQTAYLQNVSGFAQGLIVFFQAGDYFSVQSVNTGNNSLSVVNQGYPGGAPAGTVIPIGNSVSATGPQGATGSAGPTGPQGPQGPSTGLPTGAIIPYGAGTPPAGWLNADGSSVLRSQWPNLFNVIGTTFGSVDSLHFNLPALGAVFVIGVSGITYQIGQTGGEALHVLSVGELALHNHTVTDEGHTHPIPGPGLPGSGGVSANLQPSGTSATTGLSTTGIAEVNNTGGNLGHNNIPPFLCLNYIIKT